MNIGRTIGFQSNSMSKLVKSQYGGQLTVIGSLNVKRVNIIIELQKHKIRL